MSFTNFVKAFYTQKADARHSRVPSHPLVVLFYNTAAAARILLSIDEKWVSFLAV